MPVPRPHIARPRLWFQGKPRERLHSNSKSPFSKLAQKRLENESERGLQSTQVDYPDPHHNALLLRARAMQGRVFLLLGRWDQTRKSCYREAVVAHIEAIGNWEYWSWITRRQKNPTWDAIFDLSYGENSYTLAAAYDWLYPDLTESERERFREIARERALIPFLKVTGDRETAWWFGVPDSNWNTVCAGGAGLLALAFLGELEEAEEVLKRTESSIAPYFHELSKTDGGWPEGIGYWNYGMSYGIYYLLSWESTFLKKHPLFQIPALRKSLHFPIDFCPRGVPSSFGDSNRWVPQPFHYRLAERLQDFSVFQALDPLLDASCLHFDWWDRTTEFLMSYQLPEAGGGSKKDSVCTRHYRGLDWAILADQLPHPHLYLAIRGGTTEVKHGHLDLMSYQLVLEDEALVVNLGMDEYLDTTFSERRYEMFEATPAAKNCILINGVGIQRPSQVALKKVTPYPAWEGFRLDASEAMGRMRDGPAVIFCGRLFLLLKDGAILLLDRAILPEPGRMESRFHSFASVQMQSQGGKLTGERRKMRFQFSGNVPAQVYHSVDAPTKPGPGANLLRWCLDDLQTDVLMGTLFTPGHGASRLSIDRENAGFRVQASWGKQKSVELRVSSRLGRVEAVNR